MYRIVPISLPFHRPNTFSSNFKNQNQVYTMLVLVLYKQLKVRSLNVCVQNEQNYNFENKIIYTTRNIHTFPCNNLRFLM